MAVTNYTPSSASCKYNYSKLKDVIYLVSKDHVKKVYIDNDEAYVTNLTELPLRLNGFNISLNEESSLDERYKFQKTVTLSMHGYVDSSIFEGKYYVILESFDGTYWMVNIDFPSRLTYTFNLGKDTYQTDFTLACLSNFPTLKLNAEFEAVSPVCLGFNIYGIDSIKMLEKEYSALDETHKKLVVYGTKEYQKVDFLGDSATFQEVYDGENCTTTITFNIAFDAYKSSWHYNLLEFIQNLYTAVVVPKGNSNVFYAGFNFGLQPSFVVQTQSNEGSDIITITLAERSNRGITAKKDWSEEQTTDTQWIYVPNVGEITTFECVGTGQAKYLVQAEITPNGITTGRYKVLEGYENEFPDLNIIGTFDDVELFNNSTCMSSSCTVETDLPLSITYYAATCYTYSYESSCDWHLEGIPNFMSITPVSGNGGTSYTLNVCNTKTPDKDESFSFKVVAGNNVTTVNINLTNHTGFLNPSTVNINCLAQDVAFAFNPTCPITVVSASSAVTYSLNGARLIVNVPRNYSTANTVTYSISAKDCRNNTQDVYIIQDKMYEKWVDVDGYICESGNSYTKQARYTGTTYSNINTFTGDYRKGTLIASGDTRCVDVLSRWTFNNKYYCVEGNKFKAEEEEVSYDNGTTWTKTGATRLGDLVEENSSFCNQTVQYKWELSDKYQCGSE